MIKKFLFGKNWFFEDFKLPSESPNSTWGVVIEKEIYSGKSNFQKIEIFDTEEFGRILALDGLVQLSTKYEAIYHEMLVQPAIFYHKRPERALIVGGGDGGALREVIKHKSVKEIYLIEIDKKVIEVSKKYLPSVSRGAFNDKRLKIFNEDALKFVRNYKNYFDIIINDSTDPVGPSLVLWKTEFYKDVLKALQKEGVAAFQTAYLKEKFAKKSRETIKKVFPFFRVHKAFVGCFPFDEHTFSFGSKKINFDRISFKEIEKKYKKLNIKTSYYSPEIHFSSTVFREKP
ncbi:MAG TPA: polyamine aminopropyltransferase [Candidatus Humimicrobiaceae bacterium]|nr:polyamine aminopropyltransferase [Candidatus Humimicrobiaceae bacterium]